MSKVVSIHQPENFPWAGYFSKMIHSDVFVILDNVQFKKNNYQNRNRIVSNGKAQWLTTPVLLEGHLSSTIADTKISYNVDWKTRNIEQLKRAYSNCKYFDIHMPYLTKIIENASDSLMDYNMNIITYIRSFLGIDTPIVYASEMDITSHKTDLVFDICKELEATDYLSGKGGRDYLEVSKFEDADIGILYQEYSEESYYQDFGDEGFIPYMSIIDMMMNNDPETIRDYLESAFSYFY